MKEMFVSKLKMKNLPSLRCVNISLRKDTPVTYLLRFKGMSVLSNVLNSI